MRLAQQITANQARYSRPNDRDPHSLKYPGSIPCLRMDPFRYRLEIPHQTNFGHQPKHPEGGIKLPFPETLTNRAREKVMVVVPSLPKGDQCDPCVVATFVIGIESSLSEQVGDRVDREGPMIESDGWHQKSPGQPLPTRCFEMGCGPLRFTEQIAASGQ